MITKVENTVPWTYVNSDLNGKKTVGTFYKKELQKTNQKEFGIPKIFKINKDKLYVTWKGYDNSFNSWIDKKIYCYTRISYFPPYSHRKSKIELELDFSNYATKSGLKKRNMF